ncbi:RagB/SusD family nutrient uptake outer membrane protein [Palleniella muris]|uniref:RagB/SusD family nutrient uptake outer membrane protein n=1 Tax=Palleniella muris TaxID=3038145 RepID=A0AC61QVK1_9BACT|nr:MULTISPECIES: RagB/SusD family nutrient uptake outer membrane protein [Palleniella]NPD81765.1 RagB/SusD family nutrient uptake outer membrane protein [Palleniella intestinalis]TGX84223.1 RagB/SusD family nutrient uptake outer membrane protein [Palleniella muris]
MKLKNIIFGCVALSLGFTSCDMDYHEYKVDGEDYIKENFENVNGLMTTIYRDLDSDWGNYSGAMLASATDEAVYSHQGNSVESFFNGNWGPANANSSVWDKCWHGISYCNLFLDKFTNLTFDDYKLDINYEAKMEKYNNFQYEARFMRAYFYFQLVRQYGGVPLIVNYVDAETANNTPRATAEEIFKFIDDECYAIKDEIIKDYSKAYSELGLVENGRANNLTVMALRARAALYHASPLFNPENNKELWKEAALRAQECINACTSRNMGLVSKYADLFAVDSYSKCTKEILFGTRTAASNSFEKNNFPIGMENAGGGNCPTQNLVDAYETKKGLTITEDPDYDAQNPYANRDARLAATIAVNGERWPDGLATDAKAVLETYYGGRNSRSVVYGTPTGYYLKKYLQKTQVIGASNATTSYHTWVLFRLGGIYLDYAEAVLNYFGDGYTSGEGLTRTAAQAINIVRKRAGQPDIKTGLSPEAFTKRYENERFVELAFEGHRFFDVRRWKKGAEYFKDIKVMEITKNADESFTYNVVTNPSYITARNWEDKFNLFPLPQSEILKSGALTQTPGWE